MILKFFLIFIFDVGSIFVLDKLSAIHACMYAKLIEVSIDRSIEIRWVRAGGGVLIWPYVKWRLFASLLFKYIHVTYERGLGDSRSGRA